MLIHIATYPRCGSGVLRRAIFLNFGYPTSEGYSPTLKGAEPTEDPAILLYKGRPVVAEPALPVLTPDVRQRLAARPELFMVKTHEHPHAAYFPGEKAVQMVRHPGGAISSYYELKRRAAPDQPPPKLGPFIARKGGFGNWSDYHAAWRAATVPMLTVRYEDAYRDQVPMIEALAQFLDLPLGTIVTESPAQATARNPERNTGRGLDGWREIITDVDFLWEVNGAVAANFGYRKETACELDPLPPG